MTVKFQVPRSWDPGYATPEYVKAEGTQYGTYTTQWAPRGTYDNPDAMNPSWDKSYALPEYVLKEGYGQGARVTHWAPRGTYYGSPAIGRIVQGSRGATPNNQRAVAFGSTAAPIAPTRLPAAYARYGKRAARALLLRIQAVSPNQRKTELKKLMDAIDPTLWSRTDAIAQPLIKQGVAPSAALEQALAQAMGSGIATEIITMGKSRTLPKARSLLGLGCYGCAGALSALGETVAPNAGGNILSAGLIGTVLNGCTNPPAGFTWDVTAEGVGYWRRPKVGETPKPNPNGGCYSIDSRTGQPVMTQAPTTSAPISLLKVGPWLLRNSPDEYISISKSMMTAEQLDMLSKGLTKAVAAAFSTGAIPGGVQFVDLKDYGWAPGKFPKQALDDFFPVAKFKHPDTGETKAVYVKLTKPPAGVVPQLQIKWGDPKKSLWERIVGFLVDLIAAIVKPILEELGDLACQLVNTPGLAAGTQIAAGAGGTAAGGPAGAAAAGAGVGMAQNLCGGGAPPPPPAADSFPILPVALAGGAVLAIAAFWPKRKS